MNYFRIISTLFFLLTALAVGSFGQIEHSIHSEHEKIYGIGEAPSKFDPSGRDIIPLQPKSKNDLSTTVFGYLPDWEYGNGSQQYLRYDLLSHIACFDFTVSASGSIGNPGYWPWTDVINQAHSNGVKVILTAVNFDEDDIHNIITNETAKQNFFNNLKSKMLQYSMDGVNIDFEGLYSSDEGSVINNFMAELTAFIHNEIPGSEVSFAGPSVNWGNNWNLPGLAASCDYIFIMGYAFYGSWSDNTGPSAPLTGGTYNITNTVNVQYAGIDPARLILGAPYYGYHWITETQYAGSSVIDAVGSIRFRTAQPASEIYGLQWSTTHQTPWYAWNTGDWNQVWFDNDSSLGLKYDLADSKDYKGIGMWALGYDGSLQDLWNLIDLRYGSGELPAPNEPQNFRVTGVDDSTLTLSCTYPQSAEGFKIFMSKDGITFSDSATATLNTINVTGLSSDSIYYFKIKAFNYSGDSPETEVLGGSPSAGQIKVLVVNGFDRQSNTNNTRDYIKKYGAPILNAGYSFASSSNEAVFRGDVSLTGYEYVFWMLGDESTADETFNQFEQDSIKSYLKNGGKLFISGSEIGWDLYDKGSAYDKNFYSDYLKAVYVDDAPNGASGTYYTAEPISGGMFEGVSDISFDNGTHGTFDVDWPDAFKARGGASDILKFKNVSISNGGAGISFSGIFPDGDIPGKLVHLSIPFETIYPDSRREEMMGKVFEFFNSIVAVEDDEFPPQQFALYQNYPNPFNPSTKIKYSLAEPGLITLKVYDILGREVRALVNEVKTPGAYEVEFNASSLSSGVYLYKLQTENGVILTKKLVLLK